ncbi:bacterioferritin [Elusimicrobium posterum]|uniref:ferritin-like domain-containing protein n=1 Tax=Elusimicrobium posterum TaxID=3116653 RepID=UPI003C7820C1
MGKKAIEIVEEKGMKVDEVIGLLQKAYADEWLAYYQYWIGAKVAEGAMRTSVQAELEEHAKEELEHADKVAERIIQLGGTPILEPKDWYKHTNCGYDAPADPDVIELLKQNISAERCAIEVYKKLFEATKGKDILTAKLALHIMEDEIEHEHDLEDLQKDIEHIQTKKA